MQSPARLYLLVLVNGLLCGIAALNLSANVFVLKATRWSTALVWSLDAPQLWLYYSPLLFPFWLWILLRAANEIPAVSGGPAAGDAESDGRASRRMGNAVWRQLRTIPAATIARSRLLLSALPPRFRGWLAAACALSLLFGFPFAHVDLSGAPGPDSGVLLRHYWQSMVIAGLARPGAIFFCAAGLWLLLQRKRIAHGEEIASQSRAGLLPHRAGLLLFAILTLAVALRFALAGPAIPRLEDEVAYHVQALIFESGRLRGELSGALLKSGISTARFEAILQLPYVFFDAPNHSDPLNHSGTIGASNAGAGVATGHPSMAMAMADFSSAHFHGWSALLAGLAFVKLQGHANALLALLNFALFALLLRRLVSARNGFAGTADDHRATRIFALFLFACAPATVILTGTYMSHVATQSLLLALLLAYTGLRFGASDDAKSPQQSGQSRRAEWPARAGWTLMLVGALVGLAFVRLQAAVPVAIALISSEIALIAANLWSGRERPVGDAYWSTPSALLRLSALAFAAGLALWLYELYTRALGHDHWFYTRVYFERYFEAGCQAIGWGPGHGCFPTYGSLGHSFRKFLLNGVDRVSELNHELSPGGLPLLALALLLALRHWRALLDPRGMQLRLLLAFLGGVGVYSLYFHNGGESYRGRYVFETVFAFYLLFAALCVQELARFFASRKSGEGGEWRDHFACVLLALAPALLLINVAFTIRGDYFSRFIQPYAALGELPGPAVSQSVVSARDLVEQLGEREPATGAFYYPLEFETGQRTAIPLASMKAFLNLGYASLAATATRLDEYGLLRDRDDNVLVGDARPGEIRALAEFLRMPGTRRLEYRLPETDRLRRGLVRWILHAPALRPLDDSLSPPTSKSPEI